jgi:hypothetical protein
MVRQYFQSKAKYDPLKNFPAPPYYIEAVALIG